MGVGQSNISMDGINMRGHIWMNDKNKKTETANFDFRDILSDSEDYQEERKIRKWSNSSSSSTWSSDSNSSKRNYAEWRGRSSSSAWSSDSHSSKERDTEWRGR